MDSSLLLISVTTFTKYTNYFIVKVHNRIFQKKETLTIMIEISNYWYFITKIVLLKIKNSYLTNKWGEWQMYADFTNWLTDVSAFLKNSGCNWSPSNLATPGILLCCTAMHKRWTKGQTLGNGHHPLAASHTKWLNVLRLRTKAPCMIYKAK